MGLADRLPNVQLTRRNRAVKIAISFRIWIACLSVIWHTVVLFFASEINGSYDFFHRLIKGFMIFFFSLLFFLEIILIKVSFNSSFLVVVSFPTSFWLWKAHEMDLYLEHCPLLRNIFTYTGASVNLFVALVDFWGVLLMLHYIRWSLFPNIFV